MKIVLIGLGLILILLLILFVYCSCVVASISDKYNEDGNDDEE